MGRIKNEVLAASRSWATAFNEGDAAGCASAYTAQAKMHVEPLAMVSGTERIAGFWEELISAGYRDVQYLDPQVEVLSEERARLTSPWSMNLARGMIYDELWVREADGVWRLENDHFEIIDRFESSRKSHFLLVHGAWMGAWCWDALIAELQSEGVEVSAVDLPGHGTHREESAPDLDAYVEAVATALEQIEGPVILVGHSFGGITISQVAERYPERIRGLVYLSAFLLPSGASFLSATEGVKHSDVLNHLVFSDDGSVVGVSPEALHEAVAHDVPAEAFAAAEPALVMEPCGPLASTLEISRERCGRVPRYYVETTEDRAIPIDVQRAMYGAMPISEIFSLSSSHSSMVSMPEELASVLRSIAEQLLA